MPTLVQPALKEQVRKRSRFASASPCLWGSEHELLSALVNLRYVEKKVCHLKGNMSPAEVGVADADELIKPGDLSYDLGIEKLEKNLLVQGEMALPLECECSR